MLGNFSLRRVPANVQKTIVVVVVVVVVFNSSSFGSFIKKLILMVDLVIGE